MEPSTASDVTNPLFVQEDDDDEMLNLGRKRPMFVMNKMKLVKLVIQGLILMVVFLVLILVAANMATERSISSTNNNMLLSQLSQVLQVLKDVSMTVSYTQINVTSLSMAYQSSSRVLYDVASTVSDIKSTGSSTDGTVDDILLAIEYILDLQNKSTVLNSIQTVSCKNIKSIYPNSPTGVYHVNNRDIYCDMDQLCGSGGGWTRVAFLDMTDATTSCPDGYRLYTSGNVRACGRPSGGASCASSLKFSTNGISYTDICGRVTGYQYASPDSINGGQSDINSYYVDGVSITRGSPREHVWTLMAGLSDSNYRTVNCPCNTPPGTETIEPFIGSNYFCESGNHASGWSHKLYTSDPLWDGQGCGSQEGPCCAGLPWFHRNWTTPTSEYIELRVCGDQNTNDEDTPISYYEIYVK